MTRLPTSVPNASVNPGAVRKSVDGQAANPAVRPQGNRTQPRGEGGQFLSADTSTQAEGQPFSASSDGWSGVDTEASASHGPGTSLVDNSRPQGVGRYNILTTGPLQESMAKQIANAHTLVAIDGAVVAVNADAPTAVANDVGLQAGAFQAFWLQVNQLTEAFFKLNGRWPMFGYDEEYWVGRDQIAHKIFGAGSTPGTSVQGG
jgi:hypothetical protein